MNTQTYLPSPAEICEIFRSEITDLHGTVASEHVTNESLFLRAVLPKSREVKTDDWISHGVAVRTEGPKLSVHPYTFREICTNGAIHITNINSQVIELGTSFGDTSMVDCLFRQAILSCGSPEAFRRNLDDMREMMDRRVELEIMISSMVRLRVRAPIINEIIGRFARQPDRSGFGFMNAITSTARDTPNQEEKWKLETIGAGIIAWLEKPDLVSSGSKRVFEVHEALTRESPEVMEKRYASAC